MHQVEPERSLEQLAHEAGRLPFLLPRGLGDLAGLLLGGERRYGLRVAGVREGQSWLEGSVEVVVECGTTAEAVQHQGDHVALALLQSRSASSSRYAHCGRHGARVNQREPAERDDAEQELRRLARRRVVQTQLGADGGQRLLAGGEAGSRRRGAGSRSAPRARSAGRSWAERRGSRSSRRRRRPEWFRGPRCWRAPGPGRPARPRAPRRTSGPAPPDRAPALDPKK